MKKYLLLSFLIIMYAFNYSFSKDQFELKYTTADILNARSTPSIDAEVCYQLPYGTAVNVKKTGDKMPYKGRDSYWYYVKEIEAYVLGVFLSDNRPEGTLQFTYYKNDSNEGCPSDNSTLILSNMKAKHIRSANCHGDSADETREGAYTIYKKYIEIKWGDYYAINSTIYGDKKTTKTLEKGYREKLYWNSKAVGWLTEETVAAMKKFRCVTGKGGCYIDCSESCESLNNAKGCKKLTDWTEFVGTGYSYYCKTKH